MCECANPKTDVFVTGRPGAHAPQHAATSQKNSTFGGVSLHSGSYPMASSFQGALWCFNTVRLCSVVLRFPPQHIQARAHPSRFSRIAASRECPPPTPRHASPCGSAHNRRVRYGLQAHEPPLTPRAHLSASTFNMTFKQIPRIAASRDRSPLFRTSLNLSTQTTSETSSANSSTNATGAGLATFCA